MQITSKIHFWQISKHIILFGFLFSNPIGYTKLAPKRLTSETGLIHYRGTSSLWPPHINVQQKLLVAIGGPERQARKASHWQQATIDNARRCHCFIACSRHTHEGAILSAQPHTPFVTHRTPRRLHLLSTLLLHAVVALGECEQCNRTGPASLGGPHLTNLRAL